MRKRCFVKIPFLQRLHLLSSAMDGRVMAELTSKPLVAFAAIKEQVIMFRSTRRGFRSTHDDVVKYQTLTFTGSVWFRFVYCRFRIICCWFRLTCCWFCIICCWFCIICCWFRIICCWFRIICFRFRLICFRFRFTCCWFRFTCCWFRLTCYCFNWIFRLILFCFSGLFRCSSGGFRLSCRWFRFISFRFCISGFRLTSLCESQSRNLCSEYFEQVHCKERDISASIALGCCFNILRSSLNRLYLVLVYKISLIVLFRAASVQNFTLWQQATIEITRPCHH